MTGVDTSRGRRSRRRRWSSPRGLWTSELARLAGASVALLPGRARLGHDRGDPRGARDAPFLRDLDGYLYIRHYRGRFVIGAFEPNGKPIAAVARPDDRVRRVRAGLGPLRAGRWHAARRARARRSSRSASSTSCARRRASRRTRTSSSASCPRSPGCSWRPASTRRGSSSGRASAGRRPSGSSTGHPTMDLAEVDVARMGSLDDPAAVAARADGRVAGRPVRACTGRASSRRPRAGCGGCRCTTPHRAAGAAFGQAAGWERPLNGSSRASSSRTVRYDFAHPSWFPAVREEVRATREGVALYDLHDVREVRRPGPGRARRAAAAWRRRDLDVDVGRIVYTVLANERGGIEMDPTITRLDEDRVPRAGPDADPAADRRPAAATGCRADAVVTDVTSGCATLHVAGPRSRELLARLTDADVSRRAWPFLQARDDRGRRARRRWAFRVSFTGELGWELLVPTELRGGPVRARRRRRAPTSGCARPARSRSRRPASSGASARGATTSARSTIRSRPASGSPSRAARRSTSSGRVALERLRAVQPSRSGGSCPSTPRTPCCGTASRCSATASASGTSPAPRSRRPSAARPAWRGSTAHSTATGASRSVASRPVRRPGAPVRRPGRGASPRLMEVLGALLIELIAIAILFEVARRCLPYPALFVLGGVGLAFVPGLPQIALEPELVLLVFLPPLLFAAAFETPLRDLGANLVADRPARGRPGALHDGRRRGRGPGPRAGLGWAAAFALGAIVAPTDAIAATTVFRRLGVPRLVVDPDRGRVAVQRCDGAGRLSRGRHRGRQRRVRRVRRRWADSSIAAIGGIVIGGVVGRVWREIVRRLDDPPVEVVLSLVIPFAAYLPADRLGMSGVLAVVTAGLVIGRPAGHDPVAQQPRPLAHDLEDGRLRPQRARVRADRPGAARRSWRGCGAPSPVAIFGLVVLVCAVVIVARLAWVFAVEPAAGLAAPRGSPSATRGLPCG